MHARMHVATCMQLQRQCSPEEGCRDCVGSVALVDIVLQHQAFVEYRCQHRVVPVFVTRSLACVAHGLLTMVANGGLLALHCPGLRRRHVDGVAAV